MDTHEALISSLAVGEPFPGQPDTSDQLYPSKAGGATPPAPSSNPFASTGTPGDDQLYAGKADATLDGGAGDDTAQLMGSYADYLVTQDAATGDVLVVSVSDGQQVSRLANVEHLQFADLVVDAVDADTGAQACHAATMGDDQLVGNDLGYGLSGHDGNDSFTGNGGDDTLYGGKGDDVAVFRGALSDYTIEHDAWSGSYRVIDHVRGRDGTDRLWSIEQLRFADQTVDPAAVAVEVAPPEVPISWVMDGDLAFTDTLVDVMLTVTVTAFEAVPADLAANQVQVMADAGVWLVGTVAFIDDFGGSLP